MILIMKTKEKYMLNKSRAVLFVLLASAMVFVACQPAAAPTTEPKKEAPKAEATLAPGSVQLVAQGATFPLPVYDVWTKSYQFVDPAVNITYAGTGSGAGKKAIIDNTVDFAGSDSVLTEADYTKNPDLQMLPILAGAVVPIFNLQSTEKDKDGKAVAITELILDRQTLADIFQAKIKKWNDAAISKLNPSLQGKLPDAPITVVHRADSSGTTEIFTKALASFSADWKDKVGAGSSVDWPVDKAGSGIGARGNPGVAVTVQNTTNSIGYVELAYAKSNNIKFAKLINKAGNTVIADAPSIASAMSDFAGGFDARLNATIVDGIGSGSWPIVGYTYLIIRMETMKDITKAQKVVEYVKWTLIDPRATKIAADLGYATLPQAILEKVLAKLAQVKVNGELVSK